MFNEDAKLCNDVFLSIVENRPSHFSANDFPTAERIVVLVWHFTGIIDNAGFGGLFGRDIPGDSDYRHFCDAFAVIDCEPAETAIANACAVFPNGEPPVDVDERRRIWEGLAPDKDRELSMAFWDASEEQVAQSLAKYIRRKQKAGELPSNP
jgi:hypothetical protein